MARYKTMSKMVKWLSGVNALLGAWMVVALFLLTRTSGGFSASAWNNIIVGVAIFLIAGYNYMRADEDQPGSVGASALVALLGLWMLIAPFLVFNIDTTALLWSNILSGLIVAVLGAFNAYTASKNRRTRSPAQTEARG